MTGASIPRSGPRDYIFIYKYEARPESSCDASQLFLPVLFYPFLGLMECYTKCQFMPPHVIIKKN